MGRFDLWRRWAPLAAVLVLAAPARLPAEETEQRSFSVQVDGKPAGECQMSLTRKDDGTVSVSTQVSVHLKFLKYTYSYQGAEVWKDAQLQSLRSTCNDNGKRFEVSAVLEDRGLRVQVNNQVQVVRPEVWTTSFWKLPDARHHNQTLTLLDADRGKELPRFLQHVGSEQLTVGGQPQSCYHFRVTGGPSPIDLWFDAQHRLVREDFVELGHRTIVQLVSVRR